MVETWMPTRILITQTEDVISHSLKFNLNFFISLSYSIIIYLCKNEKIMILLACYVFMIHRSLLTRKKTSSVLATGLWDSDHLKNNLAYNHFLQNVSLTPFDAEGRISASSPGCIAMDGATARFLMMKEIVVNINFSSCVLILSPVYHCLDV